jgi:molecular chaperone GrpE
MKKNTEEAKIELLQKETEEWKNKYLRALADYQNLEKRINSQKDDAKMYAAASILQKLLPVIDVLDKVEEQFNQEGFSIALKQLREVVTGEGLTKIEVKGKKFDPINMECIEMDSENIGDDVTEEIRTGYLLNGKILRIARVKVGKIKEEIIKPEEK